MGSKKLQDERKGIIMQKINQLQTITGHAAPAVQK